MRTINSRKKSFYTVCSIFFIVMITISLILIKEENIERKHIKKATFVKNIELGEFYLG